MAEVVHSTGDNLIDISAVEQPEVLRDAGGRRMASQFKQAFLKECAEDDDGHERGGADAAETSTLSSSMIHSVIPLINQIQPKSLSEDTKLWLNRASKEAVAALESEPVVTLVGDLVLTFE